MISDIKIKENKIRELIENKGLYGAILATQTNFLWLTGGRRNDVLKNEDYSLVYLFITTDNKYLISSESDCERVMNEELNGLGFTLLKYNWYNQTPFDAINKIRPDAKIGADFSSPNAVNIEEDLTVLRIDLTQFEIEKVKKFGSDFSCLLTDFCFNLKPDITEKKLARDFIYECLKKDIRLHVVLIGSDERIFKYRHPVATDKLIKKHVLLATVAEKDGINITTTRTIYFGKIPQDLAAKQDIVNYIEARYSYNSKPGARLSELLEIGKEAYNEMGFEDEWKNHTQGGIIAYKPREILASEASTIMLKPNYLLSWNPTIPGAKSEDMILVKENKTEQLSIDKRWPFSEISIGNEKFIKPKILEL